MGLGGNRPGTSTSAQRKMTSEVTWLLVPVGGEGPDRAIPMASALATEYGAELRVVKPVVVPEQTPLELTDELLDPHRESLDRVVASVRDDALEGRVSGAVRVGHRLDRALSTAVSEHGIDLLVLDAAVEIDEPGFGRTGAERVARQAGCDVVVVYGPGDLDDVETVLVAVVGGHHSAAAVRIAGSYARRIGADIDLLHVTDENPSSDEQTSAEALLAKARDSLEDDPAETVLREAADIPAAIIERSMNYDLTVLGAPRESRLRRFVFGTVTDDVKSATTTPLLVVWHADG